MSTVTDEVLEQVETSTIEGNVPNGFETPLKHSKDKTPMCVINELARFNKISHQYRLTKENGPAHSRRFTVTLTLGDEEYVAEGCKIKKAQHFAAAMAIEKTKYKVPESKTNRRNTDSNAKRSNITPTVALNALAMKLGQQTYYIFDSNHNLPGDSTLDVSSYGSTASQFQPKSPSALRLLQTTTTTTMIQRIAPSIRSNNININNNNNNNEGIGGYSATVPNLKQHHRIPKRYPLKYDQLPSVCLPPLISNHQHHHHCAPMYVPPMNVPCRITLIVGKQNFIGFGRTLQQAKHDAAAKALQVLQTQAVDVINPPVNTTSLSEKEYKSCVSLVHEIVIKRNLSVTFKVLSEEGPAHMKTFKTACIVGTLITEGEGNGKKASKKNAAEKMLVELKKLPPIVQPTVPPVRKPKTKTTGRRMPNKGKGLSNVTKSVTDENQQNQLTHQINDNNDADSIIPVDAKKSEYITSKRKDTVKSTAAQQSKKESSANVHVHKTSTTKEHTPQKNDNVTISLEKLPARPNKKSVTKAEDRNGTERAITNIAENKIVQPEPTAAVVANSSDNTDQVSSSLLTEHNKEKMETSSTSKYNSGNMHMKYQLLYLGNLLGFEVNFSDYPKGNHNEFLTVVTLTTNPPQICHGVGTSCQESQNNAAMNALKILCELGLNSTRMQPKE